MSDEFADQIADIDAERMVLAAMMLHPSAIEQAAEILAEESFYRPSHQVLFKTIILMMAGGYPVNAVSLTARMQEDGNLRCIGGNGIYIAELEGLSVVPDWVGHFARIVQRCAVRRTIVGVGQRLVSEATNGNVDEATMIGRGHAALDKALTGTTGGFDMPGLTIDELCDGADSSAAPLIPGLLNSQERVVVVGPEGGGKSILGLQVAFTAASGVHPFRHQARYDPVRVLVVDLENPRDIVQRRCRTFRSIAYEHAGWDGGGFTFCHKPGGLNLTAPRDAYGLAQLIKRSQAQLVVAGPIYKMMWGVKVDMETHAQVAAFWDRMREDFGVALWLEAHAPYGGDGKREMRPEGTNLWAKWTEFGVSLNWASKAHGGRQGLDWSYFKGQREEGRPWPDWLTRNPTPGSGWPWTANYARPQSMPADASTGG